MRTKANRERARKARYALTFGLEADAVREGPCVAFDRLNERPRVCGCKPRAATIEDSLVLRWDPAHIVSVGAGGGRFDLVSLCSAHHRQQHNMGIDSFAAMYGLDLRALADERALAYEPPLGVRGLAARWVAWHGVNVAASLPVTEQTIGSRLEGYDLAALLGWVRRSSASTIDAQRAKDSDWGRAHPTSDDDKHDAIADVAHELGLVDTKGYPLPCVDALCELAGWPS